MILSSPSSKQSFFRMRNSSLLKREFLKKWMVGLQQYTSSHKAMTISERKNAIKLSADIAMASSRNSSTRWSRAVIAAASDDSRMIADNMLEREKRTSKIRQVVCSRKILKRSRGVMRKRCGRRKVAADSIAKRIVEKRTRVLRGIVPGGEFMDEISLIEETLDYISALQAQVDVMRCIATAYLE